MIDSSLTVLFGVLAMISGVVILSVVYAFPSVLRKRKPGPKWLNLLRRSQWSILLGVAGFIVGVAVLILSSTAPTVLETRLPDTLGRDWRQYLPAVGGFLALYALMLAWTAGRTEQINIIEPSDDLDESTSQSTLTETDPTIFTDLRETPPEVASTEIDAVAGARVDAEIRDALASAERTVNQRSPEVRDTLRDLAVEVERVAHGRDRDVVEAEIERGEWSDDPIVAAFLGTDVSLPLWTRVKALLRPEAHVKAQISRTMTCIERRLHAHQEDNR